MQYGRWSDRVKLNWKNILNCQYLASMNPTAGSNNVNPRLQLRFVAFAMGFPGAMSLLTIFQTFLDGHLKQGFSEEIQAMCVNIINGKGKTEKHIPPFFNRLPMRLFPFMPRLN